MGAGEEGDKEADEVRGRAEKKEETETEQRRLRSQKSVLSSVSLRLLHPQTATTTDADAPRSGVYD